MFPHKLPPIQLTLKIQKYYTNITSSFCWSSSSSSFLTFSSLKNKTIQNKQCDFLLVNITYSGSHLLTNLSCNDRLCLSQILVYLKHLFTNLTLPFKNNPNIGDKHCNWIIFFCNREPDKKHAATGK